MSSNDLQTLLVLLAQRSGHPLSWLQEASGDELIHCLDHSPSEAPPERWQDALIVDHLRHAQNVLDLGCGTGELLLALAQHGIRGQGVEIDEQAVMTCVERGVSVIHANLDMGLSSFPDASLDAVVCEQTLQTLARPVDLLGDMLRVGRQAIVSFPNFGHWRIRLDLALRGRMPASHGLPYRWYNTPNIHLFTISDFHDWVNYHGCHIHSAWVLADGQVRPHTDRDNLMAEEALFVLESP